jgi:hypothetical protein
MSGLDSSLCRPFAFLVPAGALAGLVVQRGLPGPGGQVAPVANLVLSTLVSATASWAERRSRQAWILPAGAEPRPGPATDTSARGRSGN